MSTTEVRSGAPAGSSLVPLRSPTGVALIAGTVLASGVASYDAVVFNVAVPAIGRRFDAGVAAIQWTLTSYLLAVAALLLIGEALADRFGRRLVLVIGLYVMAVASVLCASASSIDTLIAARAVQGVGGGVIAIALVPVLIGVTAGSSLADALETGYEPAMVVIGGLCAGGALVAWLLVSDQPAEAPRFAAPDRGCALPVLDQKETA